MGLMDDPIFLQSLTGFTQDNSLKIRKEAMNWYKRLNHRLINYGDPSDIPEMASLSYSYDVIPGGRGEQPFVNLEFIEPNDII